MLTFYTGQFCAANFLVYHATKIFTISSKFTKYDSTYYLLHHQSIVWPFIIIGVISNIICVILHAILVTVSHLGIM